MCRNITREWSWDLHAQKQGSRIGQREKLGCDIVTTKIQLNLLGAQKLE